MTNSANKHGWNLSSDSSDDELEILSRKSKLAGTKCLVMSDSSDSSESNLQEHGVIPVQNKCDTNQSSDARSYCQDSESIPVLSVGNNAKLVHKENSNDFFKKTAKVTKSKQKNESSSERNAEHAKLNSLKVENCMRAMICIIDSSVKALCGCENLIESLKLNSEVTFKEIDSGACSVSWQRRMTSHQAIEYSPDVVGDIQNERDILIILSALEFANLVNAHKASSIVTDKSLSEWACELSTQHGNHRIHMVCLGMENILRKIKANANHEYKQNIGSKSKQLKKKKTDDLPDITSDDIEDALTTIQFAADIDMTYVETAPDLCCLIEQMTKAVAEAPYKKLMQDDDLFVSEESTVQVDARTGKGAKKAWRQMLLLVPDLGPDMADAIVNAYPSVNKLVCAYNALTTGQGERLLADVEIRRGVGVLESKRRVGPEISRRIHRIYTSSDGDELVI